MELEFRETTLGDQVPIVGGIHLHSSVDPIEEAHRQVEKHWNRLRGVRTIIVFGLAGGFHIDEMRRRGAKSILVLENHNNLVDGMRHRRPDLFEQNIVLRLDTAADIYQSPEVLQVLSASYAVYVHPASRRSQLAFVRDGIALIANRRIDSIKHLTQKNAALSDFWTSLLLDAKSAVTLQEIEAALRRRGTGLEPAGLTWLVLRELLV